MPDETQPTEPAQSPPPVFTPSGEPITDLTPEEQAEIAQIRQQQQQPVPQLLNAYQTPVYKDADGKPISLTAAEGAEYRKSAGLVDPLKDLSPGDMVDLARQTADDPEKKFDIFAAWKSREAELRNDPAAVHNIAAAWRMWKDSTGLGDMANPVRMAENAAKGVSDLATSTAKIGWNLMQPEVQDPNSLSRDITPEVRRNLTEAKIGQKLAGMGLANQASAAVNKLARTWTPGSSFTGAAALPSAPPAPTLETDQDGLFYDSAKADDMAALIRGEGSHSLSDWAQGGGMPAESQHNLDLIKQAGLSLRPEEIQKYASGSPLTYYLFGKLFGAAGKVLPGVPQAALDAAGEGLAKGVGTGIAATAKAAESVPPVIAPFAPAAGAIQGAAMGAAHGAPISGGIFGLAAGRTLKKQILDFGPKLANIAEAGKQIAGGEANPVTSAYTQLAKSVVENLPAAAYEAGKGYLFDVATAATAETPDEAKNVGLGTFFGLMGAGRALGVPTLTGLLTGERGYGLDKTPAPTGLYPGFEKLQTDALGAATKGQAARANYLIDAAQKLPNSEGVFVGPQPVDQINARAQQLLEQSQKAAAPVVEPAAPEQMLSRDEAAMQGPDAIKYIQDKFGVDRDTAVAIQDANRTRLGLVKEVSPPTVEPPGTTPPTETPAPLTPEQARIQATVEVDPFARQLVSMGMSPEQAAGYASADGGTMRGFQGHDLYYFRDPAAAPHEVAGHGWEGLLGESAMRAFDRQIQNDPKYGGNWDAYGKSYARRLGWDEDTSPQSWQEHILQATNWGLTNAKEQVARQAIGQGPITDAELAQHWKAAVDAHGGDETATWKDVLGPEGQNAVANRYISREIFAENEDAAFKHRGGYVDTDKSLPARIARTVGGLLSYMGIDPVTGAQADYSKWPLSYDLMRGVAKTRAQVTKGLPVTAPNATAARGFRLGGIATPATPEDRQKAQQAAAGYAAEAPNIPGVRGGRTIHSLLGQLWQSMVKNIPVKIDHSGARGDPAASPSASLKGRQAEVEVERYVPENIRQQVEKIATVEQILRTSEGKYQVQVWDNNVPYANGWREAQRYQRAVAKDPANTKLIPEGLALDDKGNWTPESWQKIHEAIQTASKNYAANRTAGGLPLETSEFAKQRGQYVGPLSPSAGTLPDDMAGLVSALFGFEVPESTRMTKNMRIPANVAAQELRAQTLIKAGKRPDLPLPTPESPEFGAETTTPAQQRLAEEAGVTGRHILDLNPQRRALNEALGEKPDLIPAVQHLNVERIKDVTDLPERFPVRGRSTAIQAGFQPPREGGEAQFQAPRNPADELRPALRDSEGKIYPGQVGQTHADIYASQGPTALERATLAVSQPEHGFLRGDEFLNRQQAAAHVGETTPLQSERLRELQTQPAATQFQAPKEKSESEKDFARELGFASDLLTNHKKIQEYPYYRDYKATIQAELTLFPEGTKKVLFVGSGPVPLSSHLLQTLGDLHVDNLDISPEDASLGSQVLRKLGTPQSVFTGDAATFGRYGNYDAVILALEAGITPKQKDAILANIRSQLAPGARLLARGSSLGSGFPSLGKETDNFLQAGSVDAFGGLSKTTALEAPKGMQFQSSRDPRAIRTAAVRDQDTGTDYEGPSHFDAYGKAIDAGANLNAGNLKSGFLTHGGEFLSPDEAHQRAQEMGQLGETPGRTGLASEDLRGGGQFQAPREEEERGPVYYSQLARVVNSKFTGSQMPADQLSAILRNPQNGVKADEMKWTGLDDFLAGKQRVTKAEVQDFLKQNQVKVQEVTKGKVQPPVAKPTQAEFAVWDSRVAAILPENRTPQQQALADKISAWFGWVDSIESRDQLVNTKFESYQLPGGENYRELLFTLPTRDRYELPAGHRVVQARDPETGTLRDRVIVQNSEGVNVWNGEQPSRHGGDVQKAIQVTRDNYVRQRGKIPGGNFTSRHWDEPNVVAHTRLNDRTDSEGQPGLFAEEIQSDWHQKGLKKGYKPDPQEQAALAMVEAKAHPSLEDLKTGYSTLEKESQPDAVPAAPLSTSWHELVLRRLVRMAAEQGKAWLGWTTGEQQAERYDLSKQVKQINYTPESGRLNAVSHDGSRVLDKTVKPEELDTYVGKDVADKLLHRETGAIRTVKGEDLKVGGEGMKGFYDKILVDYANKFGKKFGAKVEERSLPKRGTDVRDVKLPPKQRPIRPGEKIHSLPITPEMKQSVLQEGVAQFEPPRRNDKREQIESAAIRLPNGKIFTGPIHANAWDAADEAGETPSGMHESDLGFKTTHGRFVDRITAAQIAKKAGQLQREPSYDVGPSGERQLDAYDIQAQPPKTYIVRHGSTELNADDPHKDKIRGFINVPLSNEGKKEANATADELKDSGIKTIITSDLTRARQTADAIAKTTGAKVVEDPGLRPWHFGPTIEGKPTDKMLPVIQSYVDAPDKRPRGGETFNEFKDRYLAAFHNAQDNYPDENTALVTHFRGLQLLKAWRETGVDNDTVDPRVFTEYSPDEKPASYDVVDKTGAEIAPGSAQFQAPREKNQTKTNETAYLKDRNDTHGWWLSPAGDLIRLKSGEHATDAFEHLGEKPSREAKTDAYHAESINAYHRLVSRGWRAVLPQTFWRQGQDFPTLIFRGGEISDKAPSNLNPTQRAAMERLAIKHDLTLQNNLGHTLYAPPARPEETSAPIEATPEQPRLTPAQVIAEREAQWEKQGYKRDPETGNFTSGQFQPPFQDPNFDEKLKEIRSGKSGGTTFNADGTEWSSKNRDEHLGSLFSVNLPLGDLNRENVENAIRKHFPLLDEPNIKAGIFAFSKDGKPTASVDLNAVISNKHIENTKRFAKQNDQVSIWDTSKGEYGEEVPTGGKGNTRLQTTDELLDALNSLTQGLPTDVDDIIKENRVEGAPERTESLPGIPTREETLTPAQAARLSNAEIAKYYPESVKAKTMPRNAKGEKVHEAIPSRITESPLYKAAGGGEAAEKSFGRKLVEFAKEWIAHPSFQSGLKWYSEFVPMLKKAFGKYHPIMAELLAGTSPNETPDSNFAMAVDALEGYKSGRFDKQIAKFEEGLNLLKSNAWKAWSAREGHSNLTEEGFLKEWVKKHNLKPRKANGKLYGISSDAVMKIFARKWLENTPGLKTQNFVQNLLGTGHEATIDLWADRTMRRLGYAGFKNRWRILPKNATGVSDTDFLFSQAAFRHAAKELGITPDALQGGLWFAEKQLWADRGYGKLDLGDFREEIKKLGMLKEGVKQSLAAQKEAAKGEAEEQPDLLVTPRNLKK